MLTMVIDLQYGSTGKGKVAYHEAKRAKSDTVLFVRTGGPNSGHTVHQDGKQYIFRQLGAGAVLPNTLNFISAGCVVDLDRLELEVQQCGLPRDRLIVDPRAIILKPEDRENEAARVAKMGTTASGNGEAMIRRMRREAGTLLAGGVGERLDAIAHVNTVAPILHAAYRFGQDIIVEGVQGFALSLLHSNCYPFCTARDTTAAAFASEVGISPRAVDRIVGVMRALPIRVGGNSGPMKDEIDWETVARESGAPQAQPELTSVTQRLRRVARFDFDLARRACDYNMPTSLAIMGLDRLNYEDSGVLEGHRLSEKSHQFLDEVEDTCDVPIEWAGTGPLTDDIVEFDV